jgi:tRNA (guanine-N7-)-methyltransferase
VVCPPFLENFCPYPFHIIHPLCILHFVVKKKNLRLAELETFSNVYQLRKDLKGKWNESVFKNCHPVTLELACGKGEYSLALAQQFPSRNFIGIDIKGARLWRGAKTALDLALPNVAFLRTYIDHLPDYFSRGEVEEIWILFPDPYREKSKARKRLTSSFFLQQYRQVLSPGATLHLKTDDEGLFHFTLETLEQWKAKILFQSDDLYSSSLPQQVLAVQTFYEKQHLEKKKTIKYLAFQLNEDPE